MRTFVIRGKLSSMSVERRAESGDRRAEIGEQKIYTLLGNFRLRSAYFRGIYR
jgi:hypothetical protein